MKLLLMLLVSLLTIIVATLAVEIEHAGSNEREGRKLFGGYRITPRFCKPTRQPTKMMGGPNICMFNHECSQRNGEVVGACMDGFLFGACCQLPSGSNGGEVLDNDEVVQVGMFENNKLVSSATQRPQTTAMMDITSSGVSQITAALLNTGVLPTAQDNAVVQVNSNQYFSTASVSHPNSPDTLLVNSDNDINPSYFTPTMRPFSEDRRTTLRVEDTTLPYVKPVVHISISNGPPVYTPAPFKRPMFRPKPGNDYVRIPTITHDSSKPNKTQEFDSIVNILQMLNQTTTDRYEGFSSTKRPPSTSYVYSVTPTRRPGYQPASTSTKKPPSTSYVFSTTIPPRTTTKLETKKTTKPYKKTTIKKTTPIIYQSTPTYRPSSTKPQSTSYVYSPHPTRRPVSTIDSHIIGPGFTVTSKPSHFSSSSSSSNNPPPTVIVLSPISEEPPKEANQVQTYQTSRPTGIPQRKPINHVTINNHVTQNIYSTSERPSSPTVLITPKPSISSSLRPQTIDYSDTIEVETSNDDLINFPPVRNPNLNMSNPIQGDEDITTPSFMEDEELNGKVESFVNKIIQGLQEPFEGLKDIVYNKNKTSTTTKKPVKKQGTTTKKPTRKTTTTRKPTTRRPSSTTTKKPKTTRRPITTTSTTTENFIEPQPDTTLDDAEETRNQCGIRPLMKTGRIVGGKGATFGEFPWQVLVRESTWLGLFTKNKCGGVLISNKYVMTAAHCQPGFLASLVAVFGEFDISGELETKRSISRNVKRVIVHRQYDAATFENDLALLELEAPVSFDSHIVPICLPREGEDFTGRMATVTGWGRLKYGGGVPSVLQEVQVPIMENPVCQEMFRTAGHSKIILESFLCAGYANGQKDSCEGDSGGPLVLLRPDGRYQLAGTVSHGIKCAAPYLPGVYMRTTYYKPWITSITGIN